MDLKTINGELQEANPSLATIVRTEDNIVVFKVFIEYKDENISKETLIKNFATFGKVQDYSLIERLNGDKILKVTYFDPLSAARLLQNRVVRLNHSDILIKACPAWEQPLQLTNYVGNIVANPSSTSTLNSSEPAVEILSLNEYCLAMIFDYLDLKSQLCFSICHDRLENIFINMICPRFKSQLLILDEFDGYNFINWMKYQFFKTAGQYMQSIKVDKFYNINDSETKVLKMIAEFCKHIERVQLIKSERSLLEIFNVLNINMLTEIELYRCNLVDKDLEFLVKCRNLASLGLAENESLFGDFLPSLKKLQRLSIFNCYKIKMDNLTNACKNMNLKCLDMRATLFKNWSSDVLEHCRSLETLRTSIISDSDLKKIMNLENLKSLKLHFLYNDYVTPLTLTKLFNKFCNNLETFKIYGFDNIILPKTVGSFCSLRTLWITTSHTPLDLEILNLISTFKELEELYLSASENINYEHLLSVVQNCVKLKRIYIYVCLKWNMLTDFLFSCSRVLRKSGRNAPLTLILMDDSYEYQYFENLCIFRSDEFLTLKMYPSYDIDGLLNDDLPVTVYWDYYAS